MRRLGPAGAAAALLLSAACTPKARPPEEIVFWQLAPPAAVEPIVRRFEQGSPGARVRVEQVARAALADSVGAALASGRLPDLCELDEGLVRALLPGGALSDWSAGVADQRDSLRGWEACRVGDALYGMPWRLSPQVLFWNPALFARAGLDSSRAPETWDALLAAATRIGRLKGGVHGYGLATSDSAGMVAEFLSFARGNGGEVLSVGEDSSQFESRANVEALEFLLRLRRASLEADGAQLDREFAEGRLGLRVAPAELAPRLDREAPSLRFGVAPVPGRVAGAAAPHADVRVLASFARSRHKELALRLARFLVRPANAVEVFAAHPDGVPANAGADTLEWFRERPRAALLAAEAGRARFAPAHVAWPEMERAIAAAIVTTIDGGTPADSAVTEAAARLSELVGRR